MTAAASRARRSLKQAERDKRREDSARPRRRGDEIVNPATDVMSRRFRPKWRASRPVSGSAIALATRYDVSTRVDSSIVADRLPAMCGSDTLTTVVSRTP